MRRLETKVIGRALLRGACVALCFFVFGSAPAAFATATTPTVPYLEPPNGSNWYQKNWVDVTYGMKRAKICVANMKANGLLSAINSVWSGSPGADIGRAIACHESSGLTGAVEFNRKKGEGGACAFQIDPKAGYTSVAKGIGLKPEEFLDTILSDPIYCAKAGRYVLVSLSGGSRGLRGGICNYFGGAHFKQFQKLGNCAMADELYLVREYVEAALNGTTADVTVAVQDDPAKECYGCYKVSGGEIGTIAVLNCHDYSGAFSSDLAKARLAYQNALRIGAKDAMDKAQIERAKHPIRDAFGSLKSHYCIGQIHDFLDSLKELLDGSFIDMIKGFILGLLQDLLDAVCALAVSAINTALEMVCLPLPKLGMPNFVLPGVDGVSCDGISLNDYISVSQGEGISLMGGGSPTYTPRMPLVLDRVIRKAPEQTLFSF